MSLVNDADLDTLSYGKIDDVLPLPGDYESDEEAQPKRKSSVFSRRGKARMSAMKSIDVVSLSLAKDEEGDTRRLPSPFPKERRDV